jgi:hypothetical protein
MKMYGTGGISAPFLTSMLDGGEWSPSRRGRLTPGKESLVTSGIGGWVGPRAGLAAVE